MTCPFLTKAAATPDEDLLSDERDKEIYNTLRAFLSALPPEKLVRIMNGAAD